MDALRRPTAPSFAGMTNRIVSALCGFLLFNFMPLGQRRGGCIGSIVGEGIDHSNRADSTQRPLKYIVSTKLSRMFCTTAGSDDSCSRRLESCNERIGARNVSHLE